MNEPETKAELIDPKLKEAGWGKIEGTKIYREFFIAPGRIPGKGEKRKPLFADYVLEYKGRKLAVIEAKADGEGIISGQMSVLAKIRKINIDARAEEAILNLELEV